jgi:Bacterial transcriptional regulator
VRRGVGGEPPVGRRAHPAFSGAILSAALMWIGECAPVRGADGLVIAALSVAAPTDRAAPDALRRIRVAVLDAAAVISRRLGHRG